MEDKFMRLEVGITLWLSIAFASAHALAEAVGPASLFRDLRAARTAAATALAALQTAAPPGSPASVASVHESMTELADLQSFTGDTAGAIATMDRLYGTPPPTHLPTLKETRQLDQARAEDAVQAIVAAAKGKRAVLINEAHMVPMHRAFTQKLAVALKKIGFTYLACEAFNDAPLSELKYLTQSNGYYTRDPMFAGLVNVALANGYKLVAYDTDKEDGSLSSMERVQRRERLQAQNIYDRIFAKDKNAKVLIHVGYHHLGKVPVGQITPMGVYLRRLLGANATLHIDQTLFYARSAVANEHPLYRTVLAKFPSASPFVLRTKDGDNLPLNGSPGFVDMEIFFPAYGEREGRPEWLQSLAGREPRDIPPELLPTTGERLILAYANSHGDDAVATDAVLVQTGKTVPKLMLPKGEFRFKVQD